MLGQTTSPVAEYTPRGVFQAAEAVGDIIEFWGFKRVLGRIWTYLYLSPRPRTAAELSQALQLSSGAVSMALQEMEGWGIIHREMIPGRRLHYYRAETHIWQMITRVVRQREVHQLEKLTEIIKSALKSLQNEQGEWAVIGRTRLQTLLGMIESGTEIFRLVFHERPLELTSLQKIMEVRQWFQRHN